LCKIPLPEYKSQTSKENQTRPRKLLTIVWSAYKWVLAFFYPNDASFLVSSFRKFAARKTPSFLALNTLQECGIYNGVLMDHDSISLIVS
jgi:hypothetical protein